MERPACSSPAVVLDVPTPRSAVPARDGERGFRDAVADLRPGDALAVLVMDQATADGDGFARLLHDRFLDAGALWHLGSQRFGVILAGPPADAAPALLNRLQLLWDEHPETGSFSAGLARREGSERPLETLDRATAALHRAVAAGGERVVVAAPGAVAAYA